MAQQDVKSYRFSQTLNSAKTIDDILFERADSETYILVTACTLDTVKSGVGVRSVLDKVLEFSKNEMGCEYK